MSSSLVRRKFAISNEAAFECWIFKSRDGKFWFKAKDLTTFLLYANTNHAITDNVHSDWRKEWAELNDLSAYASHDVPSNWQPHTVFISEPGLYALISRSKKPSAVLFTRWVYEEVLPSLRESGAYVCDTVTQTQLNELITMMKEKDLKIAEKDTKIYKLLDKILEDKPRLAVLPENTNRRHDLHVLKNGDDEYKFVRSQKRGSHTALNRAQIRGFTTKIYSRNSVPNATNILNRVKELLPPKEYTSKYNELKTSHDVVNVVRKLVE